MGGSPGQAQQDRAVDILRLLPSLSLRPHLSAPLSPDILTLTPRLGNRKDPALPAAVKSPGGGQVCVCRRPSTSSHHDREKVKRG